VIQSSAPAFCVSEVVTEIVVRAGRSKFPMLCRLSNFGSFSQLYG